MSEEDGLLWAYEIDSNGVSTGLEWPELDVPDSGRFRWIHLEREAIGVESWLRERSGLSEIAVDALIAEETRPRAIRLGEGLLVILRGVNLNPGADPEDMVSVRLWIDAKRVITIRRRRSMALADIRESVVAGHGVTSPGAFLAELADRLVERMASVLGDLDENLDAIEEEIDNLSAVDQRASLLDLRRQAIMLRRHLSPQRDALSRLSTEGSEWLTERDRLRLREVLDCTTRYVEDLDTARERAAVTQEELANRVAEQMGRRMYALSIIAGVFLPLSFATGLLGINVSGIPGAEISWAFAAVCAVLGVLAVGEIILFKKLGWL